VKARLFYAATMLTVLGHVVWMSLSDGGTF
jgi:hypothetical protein